ncbi:MAG: UbiA family prenyltransferase [Calditrichaceae bacterium]
MTLTAQKKSALQIFDYLFVLRPMLFYPGWSTMLAGFFVARDDELFLSPAMISGLDHLLVLKLFVLFGAAMGASFLLNQLQDIESDLKNKKLFIISENYISNKAAIVEIVVLVAVSILISFGISFAVGLLATAFLIVTGYLYNFRPFNLKNHPWGSLAANSMMGWLAFALGWGAVRGLDPGLILDSVPYVFFNTALYFFTTLPDMDGDRQCRKHTLAVIYGFGKILNAAFVLYIVSLAVALIIMDLQALIFIVLSFPFFIYMMKERTIESAIRTTKYGILFFAMAVCLRLPYYFVIMLSGFFFTKWYFKKRFQYDYPNFKGN